ncbi:uncharacterized protein RHIMIDRAFT_250141 [Rhizopus microsporus ATCC 52813]|uniref:Uncharacterized protein n=1 Tax=Rhizopus microsporus ATCC 52813 TaxID=1340429 RepID=A0A2G4SYX8_RHIZD|nr:uncharacterized protein RHIMIDRAFT_250141 [Rhizopus microsporus ATCC 52813]PHZ13955.1 hypothetical protein RHIMIDRAFT_250141 [Rhizopus microsporus ATCC 52813]
MMFFRKKRSNKKLINFPVLHVKPKLQQTSANENDFMEEERIVTQISPSVSTNDDTDSQEKVEVVSTISENSLTRLEIEQEPMMAAGQDNSDEPTEPVAVLSEYHDSSIEHTKDKSSTIQDMDRSPSEHVVERQEKEYQEEHQVKEEKHQVKEEEHQEKEEEHQEEEEEHQEKEEEHQEKEEEHQEKKEGQEEEQQEKEEKQEEEHQEENKEEQEEITICDDRETYDCEDSSDPVKEEVSNTDRQESISNPTNEQYKPEEHEENKGDSKFEDHAKVRQPELMDTPKKRHSMMVIPNRPSNGVKSQQRKSQQSHPSYIPVSVKRLSMVRLPVDTLEGYSSESSTSSASSSTHSHQNAFESKIPKFMDKAETIKRVSSVGSKLPKRKSYAAPVH